MTWRARNEPIDRVTEREVASLATGADADGSPDTVARAGAAVVANAGGGSLGMRRHGGITDDVGPVVVVERAPATVDAREGSRRERAYGMR